jgi:hypothetical protein
MKMQCIVLLALSFGITSAFAEAEDFVDLMQGFRAVPKSVKIFAGGKAVSGQHIEWKTRTTGSWSVATNFPDAEWGSEVGEVRRSLTVPLTNSIQFVRFCLIQEGITQVTGESSRAMGWYQRTIGPHQWSLLANQLIQRGTNRTCARIFRGCPKGSRIRYLASEWAPTSAPTWVTAEFNGETWGEGVDQITLGPGSPGILFYNPTTNPLTLTIAGEMFSGPAPGRFTARCHGYRGCSYVKPVAGTIDDFGFPKSVGDVIHKYAPETDSWLNFTNTASGWSPSVPAFEIGEAFTIDKAAEAVWEVFATAWEVSAAAGWEVSAVPSIDRNIYNQTIADHLFDEPIPDSCLWKSGDPAWLLIHAAQGNYDLLERKGDDWRVVGGGPVQVYSGCRAAVWVPARGEYRVRKRE